MNSDPQLTEIRNLLAELLSEFKAAAKENADFRRQNRAHLTLIRRVVPILLVVVAVLVGFLAYNVLAH